MATTSVLHKPKSMSVGQRNVLRHNDSASLWNCTLSPGKYYLFLSFFLFPSLIYCRDTLTRHFSLFFCTYNYILSLTFFFKGWSREEAEILRKAVMRFGIGNWKDIIESDCLPGKTNAQMNLQLQRLLGQQSTAGNI